MADIQQEQQTLTVQHLNYYINTVYPQNSKEKNTPFHTVTYAYNPLYTAQ